MQLFKSDSMAWYHHIITSTYILERQHGQHAYRNMRNSCRKADCGAVGYSSLVSVQANIMAQTQALQSHLCFTKLHCVWVHAIVTAGGGGRGGLTSLANQLHSTDVPGLSLCWSTSVLSVYDVITFWVKLKDNHAILLGKDRIEVVWGLNRVWYLSLGGFKIGHSKTRRYSSPRLDRGHCGKSLDNLGIYGLWCRPVSIGNEWQPC